MDKKNIAIFILVTIIILLIGVICIQKGNNMNANKYVDDEKIDSIKNVKNVKIEVQLNTITPNGATIIITDNNKQPYIWGESYKVQEKVKGDWKTLKAEDTEEEVVIFDSIAYELDENNQIEQKIDWTNIYGKLPKGVYRIVKDIDGEKKAYSNEFKIK